MYLRSPECSSGRRTTRQQALENRRARVLAAGLLALLAFGVGLQRLGSTPTDPMSERVAVSEASAILAGEHRYGIVEWTHHPNGPTYLIAAMGWMGISEATMRLLPLTVSALSLGVMVWGLLLCSEAVSVSAWVIFSSIVLILQPGFADWQGALKEHSYAVSIALLAVGLSGLVGSRLRWMFFPLGLLAGYNAWDWLPAQALGIFGVRALYHGRSSAGGFQRGLLLAGLDTLAFTAGASAAILVHLTQLTLRYESVDTAVRDLMGAGAARMGLGAAASLSPAYDEFLRESGERLSRHPAWIQQFGLHARLDEISRLEISAFSLDKFFRAWSHGWMLAVTALAGTAVAVARVRARFVHSATSRTALGRRLATAAVSVAAAGLGSVAWIFVMPRHAIFHLHQTPRHALISLAALIAVPVLVAHARSLAATRPSCPSTRSLVSSVLVYAAFPALLFGIFGYAVAALR